MCAPASHEVANKTKTVGILHPNAALIIYKNELEANRKVVDAIVGWRLTE
jgi:hypothetical protein